MSEVRSRLTSFAALAMLALAGCDTAGPANDAVIVTPPAATPAAATPAPSPATPTATRDVIERIPAEAPTPRPDSKPPEKMQTRKGFTDPPLPAELNQDGGLKPLPPRPK